MDFNSRKRFQYKVQLQTPNGELVTVPYAVLWDPEKVSSADVAVACAAEYSASTGNRHTGLSAVLVEDAS